MKESLARVLTPEHESLETAATAVEACLEAKGRDLTVLDVSKLLDLSSYFVVVSGRSDRHVQGIANRVFDTLEELGIQPLSIEGLEQGQWVLMDYGDVVIHIFYEPQRAHYDIEGLWVRADKVTLKKDRKGTVVKRKAA